MADLNDMPQFAEEMSRDSRAERDVNLLRAEVHRLRARLAAAEKVVKDVLTVAMHCKTYADGDVYLAATRVVHAYRAYEPEETK